MNNQMSTGEKELPSGMSERKFGFKADLKGKVNYKWM